MEEIFKQYSTPIIVVIVVVALIAIIGVLLAGDGPVADAFQDMLSGFMEKSQLSAPIIDGVGAGEAGIGV